MDPFTWLLSETMHGRHLLLWLLPMLDNNCCCTRVIEVYSTAVHLNPRNPIVHEDDTSGNKMETRETKAEVFVFLLKCNRTVWER